MSRVVATLLGFIVFALLAVLLWLVGGPLDAALSEGIPSHPVVRVAVGFATVFGLFVGTLLVASIINAAHAIGRWMMDQR